MTALSFKTRAKRSSGFICVRFERAKRWVGKLLMMGRGTEQPLPAPAEASSTNALLKYARPFFSLIFLKSQYIKMATALTCGRDLPVSLLWRTWTLLSPWIYRSLCPLYHQPRVETKQKEKRSDYIFGLREHVVQYC